MRRSSQIFIFILVICITVSCNSNPWGKDTSSIDYSPSLKRFDLEFFEAGNDGFSIEERNQFLEVYPHFFPLYVEGILRYPNPKSLEGLSELSGLTSNKDILDLAADVSKAYPEESLKEEIKRIAEALKLYSIYFPDSNLPKIYAINSLFAYNVAVDENVLAISLEMYLGGDYKYYPSTNIPKYRFKNFERKYLVSDAIKAFLISEFDKKGGQNLLEQMVYYGKMIYLVEALLPNEEESAYFNYDEAELDWCEKNESEIWFHFVDMELLYSSDSEKIRKYIDDAPFIPGFPEGSTARVGKWIGYQIVKSYMKNNSSVELTDLMENKNANSILIKSKYKPRR
jgi:hypothetical protein